MFTPGLDTTKSLKMVPRPRILCGTEIRNGEILMTPDKILVTLSVLTAIAFFAWVFWLVKKHGVKAALSSSGYQELMVLVKGGYTPDVIVVEKGRPVRLNFVRTESASCSEMVLIPDFNKRAKLHQGVI